MDTSPIEFMKTLNLDTDFLFSIGMDGPSVNKSFEKKLINELELSKGNSFLSLGSCPLQTVNNGFGEGMKKMKVIVDIEQFLIDVHFLFKLSSARREDFKEMEIITDVTAQYLLKYCSTRWLCISKVVARMLEQYDNVHAYFIAKLPTLPNFKGKSGVEATARYQRIKKNLNVPFLLPNMAFIVYATQIFQSFVLLFQAEELLIHILHKQMRKLVENLFRKFVDDKFILSKYKNGQMPVNELMTFDIKHKANYNVQREMGTITKSLLRELDLL